jgi:hypothetical protein
MYQQLINTIYDKVKSGNSQLIFSEIKWFNIIY